MPLHGALLKAATAAASPPTLNPGQLEAVHHLRGPCLVLAGAGSGKTRVIVHKIARLLEAGHAPGQIAAITFTNKAAAEMRERAAALVGRRAAAPLAISTFHSLGVRMLRSDGERLGLKPNFSILDSDDVLGVLKDAGGTTDNALARRWQWAIGGWKNRGLDAAGALADVAAGGVAGDERSAADALVAARVMERYQERLAAYQAVDFDDLIVLPAKLLAGDAEVRQAWQERLRYILVDEYQDTNGVQYELMKLIAGRAANFTAVGDDDQSIYGWRGATLDNLKRLPADFPSLKVIPLEQNYRSTTSILRAANAVIANNPKLYEKKLWSELGSGEPVRLIECDDEAHEAERAVAHIESIRGSSHGRAAARLRRAVPGQSPGQGVRAGAAQGRHPVQGLGRAELLRPGRDPRPVRLAAPVRQRRRRSGLPARRHQPEARHRPPDAGRPRHLRRPLEDQPVRRPVRVTLDTALPKRSIETLHAFGRTIHELEARAREAVGEAPARAFLLDWLKGIGYEQHLHDEAESPPLAAARWTNVLDFVDWIARRCGGTGAAATGDEVEAKSVLEVAQSIAVIVSLAERGDEQDVVTLSTLHAAKGLEWPHVVLAGINEGLLPFRGGEGEDEQTAAGRIEEERRLMYVGITRARSTLVVSTLARRKRGRETVAGVPSRFIAEMKLGEAEGRVPIRGRS